MLLLLSWAIIIAAGSNTLDVCSVFSSTQAIVSWCKSNAIHLVAVGPEDPLAEGLGDALQAAGIKCFGPGRKGAQIEADKNWSKDFMHRHGIPTARYSSFTKAEEAKAFINRLVAQRVRKGAIF